MKKDKNLSYPIFIGIIILLLAIIIILILKPYKHALQTNIATQDSIHQDSIIDNHTSNNYISQQEALNIALNHVNINQNDVFDIDIDLDYEYNQTVYEVSFHYDRFEYEFYINAESGEMIYSFKEVD